MHAEIWSSFQEYISQQPINFRRRVRNKTLVVGLENTILNLLMALQYYEPENKNKKSIELKDQKSIEKKSIIVNCRINDIKKSLTYRYDVLKM